MYPGCNKSSTWCFSSACSLWHLEAACWHTLPFCQVCRRRHGIGVDTPLATPLSYILAMRAFWNPKEDKFQCLQSWTILRAIGIISTFNVEEFTLYRGHHTDEGCEEHILALPLIHLQMIKLLMYLMIRSCLHVKEVFGSFTFAGKLILYLMAHGSPLLIFNASIQTFMNVIRLYARWSRVFPSWGELMLDKPSPSPLGRTYDLLSQFLT